MRTIRMNLPTVHISPEKLREARVLIRKARAVLHEGTKEATKDYHDALARTWIEFERIERGPWLLYQEGWRKLRRTRGLTKIRRAALMQENEDRYEAAVGEARSRMVQSNRRAWLWYRERTDKWYNEFWQDAKPIIPLFNTILICEDQREILHPFIDIDAEEWDNLEAYAKRIIM